MSKTGPTARRAGLAVPALCACYLVALAWTSVVWTRAGRLDDVVGPFMAIFSIVGTLFAVHVVRRGDLPSRTRLAWRWIAASLAILLISSLAFSQMENLAFPTAGDAIRLLFAPCLLTGLLRLLPPPSTPLERHKLNLDNAIVTAAGAMLLWYFVVGPAIAARGAPQAVTIAATAYPILDLALIFGATQVVFRPGTHARRRSPLLIAAGVLLLVIGDVYLGYQRLNSPHQGYGGLQFGCWLTGYFLFALAAVDQARSAPTPETAPSHLVARPAPWLPYLAVAAGYLVLLVVVTRQLPFYPYGGLVVGAIALTGLVQARQVLAAQENHLLATTDGLTGLANRSALHARLARALDLADRHGEHVAVLLVDLDDFKGFNDTLGHEVGDEILVSFAHLLTMSVRPTDLVARLGGDEFVVVLTCDDPCAAAPVVARRITAATHEPALVAGRTINLRASIGIAQSRSPGCGSSELLDRADAAMYRAKRAGRSPYPSKPGWDRHPGRRSGDSTGRSVRTAPPAAPAADAAGNSRRLGPR